MKTEEFSEMLFWDEW